MAMVKSETDFLNLGLQLIQLWAGLDTTPLLAAP